MTLESVDKKSTELLTWKAVHEEQHKQYGRDMKDIRATLYDKSQGICIRIQTLWNGRLAGATARTNRQRFFYGTLKALIVTGIVALTTFFLNVFK